MCGICGFVGFEDKALIQKMSASLSHRGPDNHGTYFGDTVTLGHRRLSIIDLEGGHQPIHNEDGNIWAINNGEIYNYLELTKYLETKRHKFYTSSDTEVIIHAYEEFGDRFVEKLDGIFALALWDDKRKRLILARDRIGVKPLYYLTIDGVFLFASEIKSILEYEEIKRILNFAVLHHFLTYRSTPSSETIFEGIKKVIPGHKLILCNGTITTNEFWKINNNTITDDSEINAINKFKTLFNKSVKKRLMSEVPLGVYLSGGVDSSSVVALASQFTDTPLNTFAVGFGAPTDEFKFAREIAECFETKHHELMVESNDISKILPKIVWHLDEPIADPATIPTYLMSKLTKKYVTVVLTGEGADELYAGYPKYKLFTNYFKIIPNSWKYKLFLYSPPSNTFNDTEKDDLFSDKVYKSVKLNKKANYKNINLNALLISDIKYWLPNYLLMKVDKMTMAHGLEARVPFLDHKLLEFSCKLPANLKLKGFTGKYILRKSMESVLPKNIAYRKKSGFPMPLNSLLIGDIQESMIQTLSDSIILKRYFNRDYINKILNGYKRSYNPINKFRATYQVWLLYIFALWYDIFIECNKRKHISTISV
jgi:asparagine synthase (glutamine-hydrolysing)